MNGAGTYWNHWQNVPICLIPHGVLPLTVF